MPNSSVDILHVCQMEGEDSGGEGEQGADHHLEDDKELELPEEAGGDS